jgi:DNA-binding CsgD family transcriptional regulator
VVEVADWLSNADIPVRLNLSVPTVKATGV